jgi:integrase-like protein
MADRGVCLRLYADRRSKKRRIASSAASGMQRAIKHLDSLRVGRLKGVRLESATFNVVIGGCDLLDARIAHIARDGLSQLLPQHDQFVLINAELSTLRAYPAARSLEALCRVGNAFFVRFIEGTFHRICLSLRDSRLGLRWADVDFASGFLHVRQNRVHGVTTTPKNHQIRKVDMSAQLGIELQALRRRERERCLAAGKELPPIVFASDTGTFLDVGNVRRAFYRLLTAARLRHVRFHDVRHTFASLLIQQGESLAYVRDQMGHASIQITVDTYGHLVPGGNRAAVDRLDDETQPDATPAQNRVTFQRGWNSRKCWWAARGSNPGHPD